jgi:hypothetical protein
VLGLIFIILIILVVVNAYNEHLNNTGLERQKQKFENCIESIKKEGVAKRDSILRQSQRENLEELAVIVRGKLNEFKMDIPPRLFQNALTSIDEYVDNIEFEVLYDLYKILAKTRKKLVFQELNSFFNWGYLR